MKKIEIDSRKCTACHICEIACSLHRLGESNPKKSMIKVFADEDRFIPVIAGQACEDESILDQIYFVEGRKCNLCFACVRWCVTGALTVIDG